jgi:HPt (histidine-containing phosphotransfer) domain-containing protein
MDGYLYKPVREEDFDRVLERFLPASSSNGSGGGPVSPTLPSTAQGVGQETAPEVLPDAIDAETLLANLGQDREILHTISEIFTQQCPHLLGELRAAVEGQDAPAVREAAHALKGNFLTIAASDAASLAAEIERLGREARIEDTPRLLERLQRETERVQAALSALARKEGHSGEAIA